MTLLILRLVIKLDRMKFGLGDAAQHLGRRLEHFPLISKCIYKHSQWRIISYNFSLFLTHGSFAQIGRKKIETFTDH